METTTNLIKALNWKGVALLATESKADLKNDLQDGYTKEFKVDLPIRFNSVIKVLWASIQKLKPPKRSSTLIQNTLSLLLMKLQRE